MEFEQRAEGGLCESEVVCEFVAGEIACHGNVVVEGRASGWAIRDGAQDGDGWKSVGVDILV